MDYNTRGQIPVLAGQEGTRQSPIAEAFTQLDRQIETLAKNVEELTMRLQMVLIDERPQEVAEGPRPMLPVPLANEILARREKLCLLNQALAILHQRLGL